MRHADGHRRMPLPATLVAVAGSLVLLLAAPAAGHQNGTPNDPPQVDHSNIPDTSYWPGQYGVPWNGWRVYLSPAHHWSGYKYGCNYFDDSGRWVQYIEDLNMKDAAFEAAIGAGWDLMNRGYYVRVGAADPDENTTRSNGWGPASKRRHIPMHSNASSNAPCPNGGADGTRVFYCSSGGADLAAELAYTIGASSPGSPDVTVPQPCSSAFYEIRKTTAVTAYLETEFHTWYSGTAWLTDYETWAWRVGWAVDRHLGYP